MSFRMYQGLQSCLEPPILRLKFVAPLHFSPSATTESVNDSNKIEEKNRNEGGWSFLQSINSNNSATDDSNKEYVHPLVRRLSSSLSEKSLEMCTESLGSETGSADNVGDHFGIISDDDESTNNKLSIKTKNRITTSRGQVQSFPPPLTSISSIGGSDGGEVVQVRPHREGGRLVLRAVTVSIRESYVHAERSEGRLRISLSKPELIECEKEEGEDIEEEIAVRPSRCNEGGANKNLVDWKQFWVAT
ncbi:hypothetical protein ACFE04_031923 [Oxalis oulophora]